jgi:uncharacterized membrane protein YphA (DoxX/SURF4 family)
VVHEDKNKGGIIRMNVILWVLQILLGLYFIAVGVMHFIVPPGLPAPMQWMYELPTWLHYLSGTAEILGGLGLILPGVTRIQTRLTPLAALGLILVMLGAAVFHIIRGESNNIVQNLILAALLAFVAYGRLRLHPLPERA